MSEAINVGEQTFEKVVLQSEIPVLVDFWAAWCGPCRMVAPVLDQIAAEHEGKIRIVKVNVDEEPALAAQYRITSIPAMKVFKGGEEVRELIETGEVVGPGGYVYEPAGNVDSWKAVGDVPVIVHIVAFGAMEYLGPDGEVLRRDGPASLREIYRRHCAAAGVVPLDLGGERCLHLYASR